MQQKCADFLEKDLNRACLIYCKMISLKGPYLLETISSYSIVQKGI